MKKVSPDAGLRGAPSKDSGAFASKDGMEAYVALLKIEANRRRWFRIMVLLLLIAGVIVGSGFGVSLPWDTVTTSETYDPAVGLAISLSGCDARFVPGDTATITYESRRSVAGAIEWTRPSDGAAVVSGAAAHNTEWSCEDAPLGVCSSWCRLTVQVPSSAQAAAFTIAQPNGDPSHPSVTLGAVTIGSLSTTPTDTPLPSVSFHLVASTVQGDVTLRLYDGSIHSRASTLGGSVRLRVTGGGSVRVHEVSAQGADVNLHYSQPGGLACFASDAAEVPLVAASTWASCPLSSTELGAQLRGVYDANGDGEVSYEEFTTAAEAVVCCGPAAPLACSCAPEAAALGLAPSWGTAGTSLDLTAFTTSLQSLGYRALAGTNSRCLDGLSAMVDQPKGSPNPQPASITYAELFSAYGDVSVTLRQAASAPTSATWATTHVAAGRRHGRGPRLSRPDAMRLQRRYGGLGMKAAGGDSAAYIVFDVVSSVGKPWRRWIYSTSDAFLAIDPAHLALLSGSAISPTIHRERVRMVNDDCALLPPPAGGDESKRLAAVKRIAEAVDLATDAQLRAILLNRTSASGGASREESEDEPLRGSLVVIDGDEGGAFTASSSSSSTTTTSSSAMAVARLSNWFFHAPRLATFEPRAHGTPGERMRLQWSVSHSAHTATIGLFYAAAMLAFAAGCALGLFGLYGFWLWVRRIQYDSHLTASARARAILSREELPEAEIRAWLSREDVTQRAGSPEDDAAHPITALLATADHVLNTISEVCVAPVRRRLVSSVGRFVQDKLREAPMRKMASARRTAAGSGGTGSGTGSGTGGGTGGRADYYSAMGARPIDMRELVRQYELFCIAHGYPLTDDNDDLHSYLTARHVLVHQSFVRRIFGLKWKNPLHPLQPKGTVKESDLPPELKWGSLFAPVGGDPELRAKRLDEATALEKRGKAVHAPGGTVRTQVPLEHGGKVGYGPPPPIEPLLPVQPVEGQGHSKLWQQPHPDAPTLHAGGSRPPLPPVPSVASASAAAAGAGPLPPRQPLRDQHDQIVYDEYGSPVYADSSPPAAPHGGDSEYTLSKGGQHTSPLIQGQRAPPSPSKSSSPPASPPPSPPVVPPAHGSYPVDSAGAAATRAGWALVASHAAALETDAPLRRPPPSRDAGPLQPDPLPAEWWVLRRFLAETCHEDPGSLTSFIDIEDTIDPAITSGGDVDEEGGTDLRRLAHGFRVHLYDWCRQRHRGLPLPPLHGRQWANALPDGIRFKDQLRVRQALGLEWRQGWRIQCSPGHLLAESLDVFVHFAALVLIPLAIAYYALDAQRHWAKLLCTPSTTDDLLSPAAAASVSSLDGSATALSAEFNNGLSFILSECSLWSDFAPLGPKLNFLGGDSPLPLVAFIVSDCMLLVICSCLRLLVCYLNPELAGWRYLAHALATHSYGALLLLNLLLGFSAVGMIFAWHLLGGATRPVAFLPDLAIVISAALILQSVGSSMHRASFAFRQLLEARFLQVLQPHLQHAYHRSQFQISLQRAAAVGKHLARPATWQGIQAGDAAAAAETAAEVAAAERTALLTGTAAVLVPPQAYMRGRAADDAANAAPGRTLQPIDIYLILAGDGRHPLLVDDFRPRFETLGLPLTTRQKEMLFSQVEAARRMEVEQKKRLTDARLEAQQQREERARRDPSLVGAEGSKVGDGGHPFVKHLRASRRAASEVVPATAGVAKRDFYDEHPMVTARQFCHAWDAMEQGMVRRGLQLAGVSAAQTTAAVGLSLGALGLNLTFLAVGFQVLGADTNDAFVSVVRAALILSSGAFVAVVRPRAPAEKNAPALVEAVINDDLARAAEA